MLQAEKGGNELAVGEISAGSEDYHHKRGENPIGFGGWTRFGFIYGGHESGCGS